MTEDELIRDIERATELIEAMVDLCERGDMAAVEAKAVELSEFYVSQLCQATRH